MVDDASDPIQNGRGVLLCWPRSNPKSALYLGYGWDRGGGIIPIFALKVDNERRPSGWR